MIAVISLLVGLALYLTLGWIWLAILAVVGTYLAIWLLIIGIMMFFAWLGSSGKYM